MCHRSREGNKGCCSSSHLSRLSIIWGFISLATLITAFVSNVWIYTKEPVKLPNSELTTTITFRIGLWRVCPSVKRAANMTRPMPAPACSLVKYSTWEDLRPGDLGVWSPLEFTPAFISRMRFSTPFEAVSVVLLLLATFFALVGHFNGDHKTLVACGLYLLAGLSLGSGLVVFVSVLGDAYWDRPRRDSFTSSGKLLFSASDYTYRYGWSFFAASSAVVTAEIAALLAVASYLRRYPTMEDMVRLVVPGLERKLNESFTPGDYIVRRTTSDERATTASSSVEPSAGSLMRSAEALVAGDGENAEGPLLMRKKMTRQPGDGDFMVVTPDICSQQCCDEGQLVVVVTGGGPGAALMGGQPPSTHHHHSHHHDPPPPPQRVFSELRASRTALVQAQMNTSSLLKKKSVTIGTFTTMEGPTMSPGGGMERGGGASSSSSNYSSAV